jgi:putative MATE family efflux protein
MLGPTIDMIWVGRLGANSLAAVGLSGQIVMVVNYFIMGFFTSLRAMVGRRIGQKDEIGANHVFQQSFIIAIAFSITIAVIGILLSEKILSLFDADEAVVAIAVPYNRIQFISTITIALRMLTEATMQSSGDTMSAMKIGVLFRVIHIVFCPFLVFGWSIFPELGVAGAAISNVFSQGLGGVLGLWYLLSGRSRLKVTFRGFRLDFQNIWRQIKIGVPASINQLLRNFLGLIILKLVVPFGTLALAAYSLVQRIDTFLDVGATSLGNAAGILTAQNLGAGNPQRAEKAGWLGVTLATTLMTIISIGILIWTEELVRVFNTDPGVVQIGSTMLRIGVIGFIMMGSAGVLTNCLNQAGDTMIPLIVSLVTMWGIQLPLSAYLPGALDINVYGIQWAMVIALAIRGVVYMVYFRLGRWKRRKL